MCVNSPHLQVGAVLGSVAVQGHVGVQLEDVFLQLARLQLDAKNMEARKHAHLFLFCFFMKSRGMRREMWLTSRTKLTDNTNTTQHHYPLLLFPSQSHLKIVSWHPHRQEKPLFTVHR